MQDLRLIGVHEDGTHLLLADEAGQRYRLPLDEQLRAAARRDRPHLGQLQITIDGAIRPAEVQSLIRSGLTAQEVADRTGWAVERVRRYEGPILAEREYVAELARAVRMRGRRDDATLGSRVASRLRSRGVDPTLTDWDASRTDEGDWSVTVIFPAGGRQRTASWHFDMPGRSVVAADDEARWLSEDEPAVGPIPTAHPAPRDDRPEAVYDVEAEGGVVGSRTRAREENEPIDLMAAMREHSAARRRRGRRTISPADVPGRRHPEPLPLTDLTDPSSPEPSDPDEDGPAPVDPDLDERADDLDTPPSTTQSDAARSETDDRSGGTETGPRAAESGDRPAVRRSGRPSVPSWDDIMFGSKDPS